MSSDEQRRQTPTERNHELLKLALERPAPASGNPSFQVNQEKAVGGATVWTWQVHVPVCDEYPTSQDAFDAATGYAAQLSKLFPPPNGAPDLGKQLEQSVKKSGPQGVVK